MAAEQILRIKTVSDRTGLSRSTIYNKVKAGTFPRPKRTGKYATGWLESDIDNWIRNLPDADPGDVHSPKRKDDESEPNQDETDSSY